MILLTWEIWDAEKEELLGAVMASTRVEAVIIGIQSFGRAVIFAVPAGDAPMEVA